MTLSVPTARPKDADEVNTSSAAVPPSTTGTPPVQRRIRCPGMGWVAALGMAAMLTACAGTVGQPANTPPAPAVPSSTTSRTAGQLPKPDCAADGTLQHVAFDESSQGEFGDYQVYLPPCYEADTSLRYPVVYLLHGAGEGDSHFIEIGVAEAADRAILNGDIAPMILITTDGGPGYSSGRDGVTFDQYLVDELVPRVDSTYRTIQDRGGRAVGGISMGGGRALHIAAAAPTMFAAVGGHSPVVNNPGELAAALSQGDVSVWLDAGQGDYLRDGSEDLAARLRDLDASVEVAFPEGGHDRDYWRKHLSDYLGFYDDTFRTLR